MTDTEISPALLVRTDPGTHRCEAKPWCGLLARWHVEAPDREAVARTMGEVLTLSRSTPSRYACHNHLLGALTEVLAYPLRGDDAERLLDEQIDTLHGASAARALEEAFADGSIFGGVAP